LPNEIVFTSEFGRLYKTKKEKSPKTLIEKIENGLIELRHADEPERLGTLKKGKLSSYYSYDISRGHRILYRVERRGGNVVVYLHRVCDHKNVYGRD